MAVEFTEQDHVDHARHNERFLDHLISQVLDENGQYGDWALVVTFCAALHYTKAAIVRDLRKSVTAHTSRMDAHGVVHEGHNDLVRTHLPVINTLYRELFDLGHDARYRGYYRMPGNAVAEVKRQRRNLDDIKTACGYG